MATLIKTSGEKLHVTPKNEIFTLEEMYDFLNCSCVQIIHLHDRRIMWIDECGKLKEHFEVNSEATVLYRIAGGVPGDFIAGHALITKTDEVE